MSSPKSPNTSSSGVYYRWAPQSAWSVCACVGIAGAATLFALWLLFANSILDPGSDKGANAGRGTHAALIVVQVIGAFLTPVVAAIAVYIAWQQKEMAEYKVKLDLFDRRYRVYRGLMDLLAAAVRDENVDHEVMGKFYSETDTKRFLFDDDITDYLNDIRKRLLEVRQLRRLIEPHPSISEERRDKAIDNETEAVLWLQDQVSQAAKKFDRYMSFKNL